MRWSQVNLRRALMAFCMAIVFAALSATAAANFGAAGPHGVDITRAEWRDAKRSREVPVTVYSPAGATNAPVIVFSHGLGGTRDAYAYLGRHWSSHGYVSIHVQHSGSDDSVWRGSNDRIKALRSAVADPRNAINRPQDISFVLDELTRTNGTATAIRARCDLNRIGVAGHSFGAWTTLAIAGQSFGIAERSVADPRVKAAIAMSAPVPPRRTPRTYSGIRIPVFHLTGTEDTSPINDTTAAERRVPFDLIAHAPQLLVTFEGGDHMIFSGRTLPSRPAAQSEAMLSVIRSSTTAFWDCHLKQSTQAEHWLHSGGLEKALGTAGKLEAKPARR